MFYNQVDFQMCSAIRSPVSKSNIDIQVQTSNFIGRRYRVAATSMPATDSTWFKISRDSAEGGVGGGTPL
jgi:hypothetical protein